MELIDFAVEAFGGSGLGIERGGDDSQPGLFFCCSGKFFGFDFDLGFCDSDLVIQKSRFGGLGANESPFMGDEAIDEFLFGDRAGGKSGEPALAKEFVLLGALV